MAARFSSVRPHLEVADVAASIDFYRRALGLSVRVVMGDPPVHAISRSGWLPMTEDHPQPSTGCERDAVSLTLVRSAAPAVAQVAACYFDVDEVEELARHCDSIGVVVMPLERHPWGTQDFVVRDPDGHLVAIGAPFDP